MKTLRCVLSCICALSLAVPAYGAEDQLERLSPAEQQQIEDLVAGGME